MSAAVSSRSGACLRVVPAPTRPAFEANTVGLSLTSTPFRPGELPVLLWAQVGASERGLIARRANEDRVPVPLWIRTAVESCRVVGEIALMTGGSAAAVTAALDAATECAPWHTAAAPGPLDRYADLLTRGDRPGRVDAEVVLRLSEEMAGAWRRAAIAARVPTPTWIAARLRDAPAGCVAWEIAAARECKSIAEWAYASALRSMASSSA